MPDNEHRDSGHGLIQEAGALLSSALDYPATLAAVARLMVPRLAECCVTYVIDNDNDWASRLGLAHADPARHELLQGLQQYAHLGLDPASPVLSVVRSGKPVVAHQAAEDPRHNGTPLPMDEHACFLREVIGVDAAVILPLSCRGHVLGAISLHNAPPGRGYGLMELKLAQELAHLSALAVDNARHFHEAQEAIRRREDMLSIATHELRAPLHILNIQIQVALASGHNACLGPEQLKRMQRQTARMGGLVSRLLDVSQLRTGRLFLNYEQVDLAAMVGEVAARFAGEAVQAGSTISVRAEAPAIGCWDRTRVEQVVTNLLANAVKYGAGRPIEIAVEPLQDTVRLSVMDQGIGIPPEEQPRIFERFQRGTAERGKPGLGLGLYIVRKILDALGGTIQVSSQPGSGSTFSVELPRDPPECAEMPVAG